MSQQEEETNNLETDISLKNSNEFLNDIPLSPKIDNFGDGNNNNNRESTRSTSPPTFVPPTNTTTIPIIQSNNSKKVLSFTNDMWDGFDLLCKRTEIGIEQCKELLDFFKKRASVEEKYAKSLNDYFSKFKLKDENDSFQKGVRFLTKLNDFENSVHKTFSQNLLNNLCHPFTALVKDMESRRKILVQEGQKLRNELNHTIEDLKKSHQKYEKICKETESVKIELISFVDNDPNSVKMNQIEKKISKCEGNAILAEEEYKNQLKITNDFITNQYHIRMIENLNEFEQFEAMRLQFMKSNIKNYFGLMMEVPNSMESEINSFFSKSIHIDISSVDIDEDLQHFIKTNSTPKKLIPTFQFEPYLDGKLIQINKEIYNNQFINEENNSNNNNNNSSTTTPVDDTTTISSTNPSTSPPLQKSIKENIFGLFNNAKSSISNLKSSTTSAFSLGGNEVHNSQATTVTTNLNQSQSLLNSSSSKIPIATQFNKVFGVELEELMDRQKKDFTTIEVPMILMEFVQTLIKLNALETEGIFTAMPPISLIQKEKQKLDQLGTLAHITDVHLAATLFKHWLRDLSNPLISFAIYDDVLESPKDAWKIIESNSPVLHSKVLYYIIGFLSEFLDPELLIKSKIDSHQIATALAPVLIRSPNNLSPQSSLTNSIKEIKVIESLLEDALEKRILHKKSINSMGGDDNSSLGQSPNISGSYTSFSPVTFNSTPSTIGSINFNNITSNNNNNSNITNNTRNFSSISFGSNTDGSTDDELSKEFVEC